jgi:hypothetical protein
VGADHVSAARADHSPLTCPALARSFAHLSHHSDRTFHQVIPSSFFKKLLFSTYNLLLFCHPVCFFLMIDAVTIIGDPQGTLEAAKKNNVFNSAIPQLYTF